MQKAGATPEDLGEVLAQEPRAARPRASEIFKAAAEGASILGLAMGALALVAGLLERRAARRAPRCGLCGEGPPLGQGEDLCGPCVVRYTAHHLGGPTPCELEEGACQRVDHYPPADSFCVLDAAGNCTNADHVEHAHAAEPTATDEA